MKAMRELQKNKILFVIMFFSVMIISVFTEKSVDSMKFHFFLQTEDVYKLGTTNTSKESYIDETDTLDQKVPIAFLSMKKQCFNKAAGLPSRRLLPFEKKELAVYFDSVLAVLFKIVFISNVVFILLFMMWCSFFYARSRILRCIYKSDGKKELVFLSGVESLNNKEGRI